MQDTSSITPLLPSSNVPTISSESKSRQMSPEGRVIDVISSEILPVGNRVEEKLLLTMLEVNVS